MSIPLPTFPQAYLSKIILCIVFHCILAGSSQAEIISWGNNNNGQLGINQDIFTPLPVAVDERELLGQTLVKVASDTNHCVAITSLGRLYAWGRNDHGQLGTAPSTESNYPSAVDMSGDLSGKTPVSLALGRDYSLVLDSEGLVYAWGRGQYGTLGQGNEEDQRRPVLISGGDLEGQTVKQIAAGQNFNFALTTNNEIVGWGYNYMDIFRTLNYTTESVPLPIHVADADDFDSEVPVYIAAGWDHVIVLTGEGNIYSWGNNSFGELGVGDVPNRYHPTRVTIPGLLAGEKVTQISASSTHTLALTSLGRLFAWGEGESGELGNGSLKNSSTPVQVILDEELEGKSILQISTGRFISILLTTDGQVFTCGLATVGKEIIRVPTPYRLYSDGTLSGKSVTQISSGEDSRVVIALTSEGKAVTWGTSTSDQLGDGMRHQYQCEAQRVSLFNSNTDTGVEITHLAAGENHSLCILSDGRVMGWGLNDETQTGSTAWPFDPYETRLADMVRFLTSKPLTGMPIAIDAGKAHSVILTDTGKIFTWGSNSAGQLGTDTVYLNDSPYPVIETGVLAGVFIEEISAAGDYTLARSDDGKLFAWGLGTSGQLGDSTSTNSRVPIQVKMTGAMSGKTAKAISAGTFHALTLTTDGQVFAWGSNNHGQLGTGDTVDAAEAVQVNLSQLPENDPVLKVVAGNDSSFIITESGLLYGWGNNQYGQLGLGHTVSPQLNPTAIPLTGSLLGKQIQKVQAGASFALLQTTDGMLYSMGRNHLGSLGTGDTGDSWLPIPVPMTQALTGRSISQFSVCPSGNHVLTIANRTGPKISIESQTNYFFSCTDELFTHSWQVTEEETNAGYIKIYNPGDELLTGFTYTLDGPDADAFDIESLPESLAPGEAAFVNILLTSPEKRQLYATLHIGSNDPENPSFAIHLSARRYYPPSASSFNVTVNPGGSVVLTPLSLTGTGPFRYSWGRFKTPAGIRSITVNRRTQHLDDIIESDQTTYRLIITGPPTQGSSYGEGEKTQIDFVITVNDPPQIRLTQSTTLETDVGGHLSLGVAIDGGKTPIAIRWLFEDSMLMDEYGMTLKLENITPAMAGVYRAQASNEAGTTLSYPVTVTVNENVPPVVLPNDPSRFFQEGAQGSLFAEAYGDGPLKYQWFKNGVQLSKGKEATLTFSKAKLSDAGIYSCLVSGTLGEAMSNDYFVGIYRKAPELQEVKEGGKAVLKAVASAPKGCELRYEWMRASDPVPENDRTSGQNKAILTITDMRAEDVAYYNCRVTLIPPKKLTDVPEYTELHGTTNLVIPQPPVIVDFNLPEVLHEGEFLESFLVTENYPTRFTSTKLPPGLKLDPLYGFIIGIPTKARIVQGEVIPYTFTITASNAAGQDKVEYSLMVLPLSPNFQGGYVGLIDRDTFTNGQMGGMIQFTVTRTNAVSGQAIVQGKMYRLATPLAYAGDPTGQVFFSVDVPKPGAEKRKLRVVINPIDLTLEGGLTETEDGQILTPLTGGIARWSRQTPSDAYEGLYNVAFSPVITDDPTLPQGHGFATLKVNALGSARWVGTLADGTSFTQSSLLRVNGHLPLHGLTKGALSSLQGWQEIDPETGLLTGAPDWYKLPETEKSHSQSYPDGFSLHELKARGAIYTKPIKKAIVLGLPNVTAPETNAEITLTGGGLEESLTQEITLTNANKMSPLSAVENPLALKLTVSAATGRVNGSYELSDINPLNVIGPQVLRQIKFAGLVIPHPEVMAVLGHFQLAELPDEAGENLKNTPTRSGTMTLTAKQ